MYSALHDDPYQRNLQLTYAVDSDHFTALFPLHFMGDIKNEKAEQFIGSCLTGFEECCPYVNLEAVQEIMQSKIITHKKQ